MSEDKHHDHAPEGLGGLKPEARAEILKRARSEHGYSIEDLALTTGLTESEISALEAGEVSNPAYLDRLAKSLGIPKQ